MKNFFLLFLFSLQLLAFDTETAAKIFTKIFSAIFSQESIKVYTQDKQYHEVIDKAENLALVGEPNCADILLINQEESLPTERIYTIFTTNLLIFRSHKDVIGAFYWEYGRPKIVFLKERLQEHNITLSNPFTQYIVKELP